jgi:hypothetical protein
MASLFVWTVWSLMACKAQRPELSSRGLASLSVDPGDLEQLGIMVKWEKAEVGEKNELMTNFLVKIGDKNLSGSPSFLSYEKQSGPITGEILDNKPLTIGNNTSGVPLELNFDLAIRDGESIRWCRGEKVRFRTPEQTVSCLKPDVPKGQFVQHCLAVENSVFTIADQTAGLLCSNTSKEFGRLEFEFGKSDSAAIPIEALAVYRAIQKFCQTSSTSSVTAFDTANPGICTCSKGTNHKEYNLAAAARAYATLKPDDAQSKFGEVCKDLRDLPIPPESQESGTQSDPTVSPAGRVCQQLQKANLAVYDFMPSAVCKCPSKWQDPDIQLGNMNQDITGTSTSLASGELAKFDRILTVAAADPRTLLAACLGFTSPNINLETICTRIGGRFATDSTSGDYICTDQPTGKGPYKLFCKMTTGLAPDLAAGCLHITLPATQGQN